MLHGRADSDSQKDGSFACVLEIFAGDVYL